MSTVSLQILSPAHNTTFVSAAADTVNLRGEVTQATSGTLYYKWYSSLNNPAGINSPQDAAKAALNWPNHNALALTVPLAVGSHILTFTAKDVEGESLADLQAVQLAAVAGGPPKAQQPCLIHVFRATMITAPGSPAPLPLGQGNAVLMAEAPLKWSKKDAQGNFVWDDEYHAINRIRYRWRFEPGAGGPPIAGLPALNASDGEIAAFQSHLQFQPIGNDHPPYLRYQGSLPTALQVNTIYRLVLRVEDTQPPHTGDEAWLPVVITV